MDIAEALDAQLDVFNTFGWYGEQSVYFGVENYVKDKPCKNCDGDGDGEIYHVDTMDHIEGYECPVCLGEGETLQEVSEEYVDSCFSGDNTFDMFKS